MTHDRSAHNGVDACLRRAHRRTVVRRWVEIATRTDSRHSRVLRSTAPHAGRTFLHRRASLCAWWWMPCAHRQGSTTRLGDARHAHRVLATGDTAANLRPRRTISATRCIASCTQFARHVRTASTECRAREPPLAMHSELARVACILVVGTSAVCDEVTDRGV